MTIFYKSTLAFRKLSLTHQSKRLYTQLSHPVYRIAEADAVSSTASRLRSKSWMFVPTAIAVLGLGFSTFSTHQLMMCCNENGKLPIGKKP